MPVKPSSFPGTQRRAAVHVQEAVAAGRGSAALPGPVQARAIGHPAPEGLATHVRAAVAQDRRAANLDRSPAARGPERGPQGPVFVQPKAAPHVAQMLRRATGPASAPKNVEPAPHVARAVQGSTSALGRPKTVAVQPRRLPQGSAGVAQRLKAPNVLQRANNNNNNNADEKIGRENEIRDVLFSAEVSTTDYGLPQGGMNRFAEGVKRGMAPLIDQGGGKFYSSLTGYDYQLSQVIAASQQHTLQDVEVQFNGVLSQYRYADIQLTNGDFVECKAYALGDDTSNLELSKFFGQAYDYSQCGTPVIYRFKNGAPTWAETTLFCIRQWTGQANISIAGNAPVYRGAELDRNENPIVKKLKTLHNTLLNHYPPPL